MSATRRPFHVLVAIGASAGVYAASLVAVTALQIQHDQDVIADRRPVLDAIEILGQNHGSIEQRLTRARSAFNDAIGEYGDLAHGLQGLRQGLTALDRQVAAAEALARQGLAFKLPASGQVVQVPRTAAVAAPRAAAAAPLTAAEPPPPPVIEFAPAPPPPPPPPQHGKTCASGK
jgi:hypothetical protein